MCVYVYHMRAWCAQRPEEGVRTKLWTVVSCPAWDWDLNPHFLQEKTIFNLSLAHEKWGVRLPALAFVF